jgi:CDP-glucose 4,6-dehydratase
MALESLESYWDRKRVFVTGAPGFLGSWLVQQLVAWNATVVGLVFDRPPCRDAAEARTREKYTAVNGRLEDYACLLRGINEYEIDTVIHLGAQPIVGTANRSPISTFESNIRGTWNLLEACRQVSTVKRVVVASSDKAYGDPEQLPYTEDMPLRGQYPYDVSKSCADLIAHAYYATYGLPVCVTRCGNFFGGRDLNFNRVVPGTIRSVLSNERPIIRSDGASVRDYIYVRDVIYAYLELARQMERPEIHGNAFNFSNEIKLSVLDLTGRMLRLMGREDLKPDIRNEARGEIKDQYLSSRKAHEMLGWAPRFTVDDALSETIAWYRDYFDRQKSCAAGGDWT